MTLRVTILGCGSSGGVPRADGSWGACDPGEPRNYRTRCGLMLQRWRGAPGDGADATTVLIDTSPDLRAQLLAARVTRIDAVVYSHDHADQTHGLDDLRAFVQRAHKRMPIWMDQITASTLSARFKYVFAGAGAYPPIFDVAGEVVDGEPIQIAGPGGAITLTPLLQDHGGVHSFGFRLGAAAYSNDVAALPEATFARLADLDLWIVDALRRAPHPTHAHLARTLDWIARLAPARSVLTNLHTDMDYGTLVAELPTGVEPAYDGWNADFADC